MALFVFNTLFCICVQPGPLGKVDKQLEEATKKCSESSSELTSLRNDNKSDKMFLPDSEKEKSKVGGAAGGEKVEKVKIC